MTAPRAHGNINKLKYKLRYERADETNGQNADLKEVARCRFAFAKMNLILVVDFNHVMRIQFSSFLQTIHHVNDYGARTRK